MQLTSVKTNVLSNIENASTEFRISDMNLVMELLTKLYSNPIQTITQEYIANARDAHRETGQTKRIRITAPSRFNSVMSITDYGPGLSPDRIQNVFVYYGSSTKRSTNTQNGGFGIGAKSAWAYTDSFTIISRVDGIKRTYVAHRSNAKGNLQLISEEATVGPNGTTIEIAVRPTDVDRFRQAVLRAVYFWTDLERPELLGFTPDELNGLTKRVVKYANADGRLVVYDNIPSYVLTGSSNTKNIVVIDGIPYPNRIGMEKLGDALKLPYALFLNTGEVTMLPSREEFTIDDKAKKFLGDLDVRLTREVTQYVNDQVAKNTNLAAGLKHAMELRQMFGVTLTYKNYKFDYHGVYLPDPNKQGAWGFQGMEMGTHIHERSTYRRNSNQKKYIVRSPFSQINAGQLYQLVYDDIPGESAVKRMWRIRKLITLNGACYLIKQDMRQLADDTGAIMLSSIDASDYKAQRAAKSVVAKQEVCVHFCVGYAATPKQLTISDVVDTIVYASLENRAKTSVELMSYISSLDGHRFGFISDSYLDKIKSSTQFISLDQFISSYTPTLDQVRWQLRRQFNGIDCGKLNRYISQIDCPVIKYVVNLCSFVPGNAVSSKEIPAELISKTHPLLVKHEKMQLDIDNLPVHYPLLETLMGGNLDNKVYVQEVINYLNSK